MADADRERFPEERLRLGRPLLDVESPTQVEKRRRQRWMMSGELRSNDPQRLLGRRFGAFDISLSPENRREIVPAEGEVRVIVPQGPAADRERLSAKLLGFVRSSIQVERRGQVR